MSNPAPAPNPRGRRAKVEPWYTSSLESISPAARAIFEEYSGIPSDQVIPHIKAVREKAWDIYTYPCIGQFRFLDLSISQHPAYARILSIMTETKKDSEDDDAADPITKPPPSPKLLLDLGCCFAQDIRKLIVDGVPSQNTYACDLNSAFINLGYELFQDEHKLRTKFFITDIFNDETLQGPEFWAQVEGKMNIVYAGSFLHLFDWEKQCIVVEKIVRLTRAGRGSLVCGRQVGNERAGVYSSGADGGGGGGTGAGAAGVWRHDVASFERMWEVVGRRTGSEWKVDATLDEGRGWIVKEEEGKVGEDNGGNPKPKEGESERGMPEGTRRLRFTVERIR